MNKLETLTPRERVLDVFYRVSWRNHSKLDIFHLSSFYARSNVVTDEIKEEVTTALAGLVSEGVIMADLRRVTYSNNQHEHICYYRLSRDSDEWKNVKHAGTVSQPTGAWSRLSDEQNRTALIEGMEASFAYAD